MYVSKRFASGSVAALVLVLVLVTGMAGCNPAMNANAQSTPDGVSTAAERASEAAEAAPAAGLPVMPATPELEQLGLAGVAANFYVLGQLCGIDAATLDAYRQREQQNLAAIVPLAQFDANFEAALPLVRRHLEPAHVGYTPEVRRSTCEWATQAVRGDAG